MGMLAVAIRLLGRPMQGVGFRLASGLAAPNRPAFPGRWATLLVCGLIAARAFGAVEGLPLTRFYPFEEIGRVSRGPNLGFDPLGRVAVVQQDEYLVLNDSLWLRLSGEEFTDLGMYVATQDIDGTLLYGALGSWGALDPMPNGQIVPRSLVPADYPKWVLATTFGQIIPRPEGVYFVGWNGVVFRDRRSSRYQFFEVRGVSRAFEFEGRLFVSSHDEGVLTLDTDRQRFVAAERSLFGNVIVGRFANMGSHSALLASTYRQLLLLHDGELKPLPPPLGPRLSGAVTALQSLPEGDVAVSITGVGLHIVNAQGQVKLSLTGPEYSRITALASNEPGVLWAATEAGVVKVLYGQPFTTFGQALGLPVGWPQVVSWQGQVFVASSGRIYLPTSSRAGEPSHFELVPHQPPMGAWGIATVGSSLLVGNNEGVYVYQPGDGFSLVLPGIATARLVGIDASTCIVIGADEIAAIRLRDGHWEECAPRIPGIGYPAIVHAGRNSAWIELGVNRAARIALAAGRLQVRSFEQFPWQRPSWVNISVVGSTAVLTGTGNMHVFFDEERQSITDTSPLADLFAQAPYPLMRITADDTGTLWGSHQRGILSLSTKSGPPVFDAATYRMLDERAPQIQPLPGGEVWVSTGQSLYHLNRPSAPANPSRFQPVLVAVRNSRTQTDTLPSDRWSAGVPSLSYDENSVSFQFFSGSYASMRPPSYEYRLNDEPWKRVASGSAIGVSDLHEGHYRLSVRLDDGLGPISPARDLHFEIRPPWYRSWYAFTSYPLLTVALLAAVLRFSMRRAKARNAALEKLVAERNRELQATMLKLQQETRTSATLAERNRLAGEIHDSLEQGFTGLKLQLETTADFTTCPPEVKSGLAVALNMVAFSRSEVRNAVLDMHSSILASADLETALRQILAQVAPHPDYAALKVEGTLRRLGSTIEHHLLRIAQEAIANAVKHASARHLEVTLVFRDTEVELTIADDGRGFDAAAVLQGDSGHFGLPSFRGRASKLGGAVEIASRPGAGTRITVRVPLDPVSPL